MDWKNYLEKKSDKKRKMGWKKNFQIGEWGGGGG